MHSKTSPHGRVKLIMQLKLSSYVHSHNLTMFNTCNNRLPQTTSNNSSEYTFAKWCNYIRCNIIWVSRP